MLHKPFDQYEYDMTGARMKGFIAGIMVGGLGVATWALVLWWWAH